MTNCIKCGKPATRRISPDLDIDGIGACDEHIDEIRLDIYLAISTNNYKRFEKKYGTYRNIKS